MPLVRRANYRTVEHIIVRRQETTLSAKDLMLVPDIMVRVLRKKTQLLDVSAREYLLQRALACIFSERWFDLVMELALDLFPGCPRLAAQQGCWHQRAGPDRWLGNFGWHAARVPAHSLLNRGT